ncbi:MAG: SulP family inorganic anion transporter [Nitrospinaceae bacterium]|nr:SulP family inorganic anion transporter [Nitrospinaceae bacterium]MBT6346545.1 SulP family inorganic anion transporter [Nitrospina sp.]
MKEPNLENKSELSETLSFVTDTLKTSLREINPWNNIKIMHTNIGQDILAGMVVAIIALPLALAFGVGSGLGAITGLWGAIAGGIIGGLFGGCKTGVSGPTGPKMAQLAMIMVGFRLASGEPDLSAAFAIIFFSGVILIGISLMGISKLIYFVPYSVVAGFMCGIGIIVMILEFDSFFGYPAPHSVMEGIYDIPNAIMHFKAQALMVSVPTLAILFIWPRIVKMVPKAEIIPAPLLALLTGTAIANMNGFDIEYIGTIPTGFPDLYWPDWSKFGDYLGPAAGLAGLAVFDSLLTCIVADNMTGTKHSSDRESFGQGLANCAAGLVGGLTTATATMRTVANIQSGGKTPLSSVVHGLVLLALVLGLGPYAEQIPMACLAAILFKVGIDILDYRILPVLHRLPLTDMIVFWTVLIITIVEDLLIAMAVGIVLAFFRFVLEVSRTYKSNLTYLEDDVAQDLLKDDMKQKVKILCPRGPMFFGAVKQLEDTYAAAESHDTLIINLKDVSMIDLSGAYALEDLVANAEKNNKNVLICSAPNHIMSVLKSVKVLDRVEQKNYFDVINDAVSMAKELSVNKVVCLK